MNATRYRLAALAATCLIAFSPAHAQQAPPDDDQPTGASVDNDTVSKANASDIAKESQNPVGNLTILPLENYTNFGVGPHDGTQNILEFEPVGYTRIRAGGPDSSQPGLEPPHPRDHTGRLEPGSVAVPERAAGVRADGFFRVPIAEKRGRRL